jgi:hypothetical protein
MVHGVPVVMKIHSGALAVGNGQCALMNQPRQLADVQRFAR